jgi:ornithine decarboxylase
MQMRAGVARKTIKSIRQQVLEQTHLFDSHAESSLDFEKVRAAVKNGYDKPFLLIDSNIIREKTRRFTAALPRVRPHYAVKANPDRRVLKVLLEEGAGFEIASLAELDFLRSLGATPAEISQR